MFVHGLNPRSRADFARKTWTHQNGNFWPATQLPQHISSARVLLFSYNSQAIWDANENGIKEHASNLLDRLSGSRKSTNPNVCIRSDSLCSTVLKGTSKSNYKVPIIFVAHSLGGLVVKQVLVISKNDDTYAGLREATYGLVFFAVPHRGGNGADLGTIAKNIVTSLAGSASNDLIESLKSNSLFSRMSGRLFQTSTRRLPGCICDRKSTYTFHQMDSDKSYGYGKLSKSDSLISCPELTSADNC